MAKKALKPTKISNAQRKLGWRDEYIYNVNTDQWYIRQPGENYLQVDPAALQ